MTPPQQPDQQVLTCFLVPRLAEADHLQTVSHHRLCAIDLISTSCKGCCSESQLHNSYKMAYSFGLHPGPDLLQLSVCTAPNIRPEYWLRIYCVWSTSPRTGQLRSEAQQRRIFPTTDSHTASKRMTFKLLPVLNPAW